MKVENLKELEESEIIVIEQDHNKYSLEIRSIEEYIIFMINQNEKIFLKKMKLKDLKDTESNYITCINTYKELIEYLKTLSEMKKLLIIIKSDIIIIKFDIEYLFKKHNIEIELYPKNNIEEINNNNINNNIKCKKCNNYPDITIYNIGNRVKIFTECKNKHINISLLDDYIKNNYIYNNNKCEKCNKNKNNIKICQLCNNYLCEECNNKHLTIDHIINNNITKLI